MRKTSLVLALFISLILPTFSSAAIFYVSRNGSNATGNSWSTAWNELNQISWGMLSGGDTVYIDGGASGTMTYNTSLTAGKGGSASARITIARSEESGHNGTVSAGSMNFNFPYITIDGKDRDKFLVRGSGEGYIVRVPPGGDFFEFKNASIMGVFGATSGTLLFADSAHVDVRKAHLDSTNNEDQIKYNGTGGTLTIEDSVFTGLIEHGAIHEDIVQVDTAHVNLIVRRNIFRGATDCFMMANVTGGGGQGNAEYAYNVFDHCADSIKADSFTGLTLINNLFDSTRDVIGTPSNAVVINNIYTGIANQFGENNIHLSGHAQYSIWDRNSSGVVTGWTDDANGTGDIIRAVGQPLFVDSANHDYRLADNSIAINKGTSAGSYDRDVLGNPIVGTRDIGPYEYTGTGSILPGTWYVDNAATGANTGTSWANAWKSVTSVSGVAPGDTIYISGGSSGKSYSGIFDWQPPSGTNGNPITFKHSNDTGHNGTVTFNGAGAQFFLRSSGTFHDIKFDFWDGTTQRLNIIGYGTTVNADSSVGFTLLGATLHGSIHMAYAAVRYEIAHNIFNVSLGQDNAITLGAPGSAPGWGVNSIHDNIFNLERVAGGSGAGEDGIQWGNSVDVYNNYFKGIAVSGASTQHQDGFQTDGQYTRVFNNTFENIGNAGTYIQGGSNIRIYNNVYFLSDPAMTGYHRGIDFNPATASAGTSNDLMANNTFVDYNASFPALRADGWGGGYTNVNIVNNIGYGNSKIGTDTGIYYANNLSNTTAVKFVSYSLKSPSNNFHLASNDTAAINQGASTISGAVQLSTFFTTDRDGNSRPSGGAWDIGAYEYGGVVTPVNGVCGTTLNACSAGSLVDVPDNATQFLWQCAGANGGSTANCSLAKPTPPNVSSGTTFTTIQFDVPFDFNLTDPGIYKLTANITTVDGSFNSVYLDIDHNPGVGNGTGENDKTWDMDYPLTAAARDAAWRGVLSSDPACQTNITQTCDQYNPKTWDLTAGLHTLYLNTREGGVQISSIKFVKVVITPPSATHPGDANTDSHMTLNEATQYGFCWKSAPAVPSGCPVGANLNNATRAGLLYGSTIDGVYHFDSTQSVPACWVPGP